MLKVGFCLIEQTPADGAVDPGQACLNIAKTQPHIAFDQTIVELLITVLLFNESF